MLYTLKQSSAKSVFVTEYVSRAASLSPSPSPSLPPPCWLHRSMLTALLVGSSNMAA